MHDASMRPSMRRRAHGWRVHVDAWSRGRGGAAERHQPEVPLGRRLCAHGRIRTHLVEVGHAAALCGALTHHACSATMHAAPAVSCTSRGRSCDEQWHHAPHRTIQMCLIRDGSLYLDEADSQTLPRPRTLSPCMHGQCGSGRCSYTLAMCGAGRLRRAVNCPWCSDLAEARIASARRSHRVY